MSDVLLTTDITGRQSQPMIGYAPDGSYVVTWATWADNSSAAVRAQRFDASGAPLGGVIEVSSFAAEIPLAWGPKSDVAVAADGSFVIAWREGNPGGTGLLRRYDADGTPAGELVTFATGIPPYRGEPTLAMLPDGSFTLAFAQGSTIQVRQFDASDTPVGAPARSLGNGSNPSMAVAGDGTQLVVWDTRYGGGSDGSGSGVFAQRVGADGTAVGAVFRVNASTDGDQQTARVAMDAAGNSIVVWESSQAGRTIQVDGSTVTQFDIFAQRYDSNGVAVGGEFRVNSLATGDYANASVAMAADGSFIIAWASDAQDGSRLGVFARRFDANGVPQGPEFRVNLDTLGAQHRPVVEIAADGSFAIAWDSGGGLDDSRSIGPDTELGGDGSQAGVYIRRFLADGTPAPAVVLDLDTTSAGADRSIGFVPGPDVQVALGNGVAIEAVGIPLLTGATARLEARPDGASESLGLNAAAAAVAAAAGIAVAWDAATGVLTLSGSASAAAYETVLEGLSYANAAATPTGASRVVAVQVTAPDGLQSLVARATFTEWDGTPRLTLDLDTTATGTGSAATVLTSEGPHNVFGADVAIGTVGVAGLTGATVLLGGRQNAAQESLVLGAEAQAAAAAAGITASWDATSGLLTLSGAASAAAYEAALEGVRFAAPETVRAGSRTLTVNLTGEGGTTASASGTLMAAGQAGADASIGVSGFTKLARPQIAADTNGNWLVVWDSDGQDGSGLGVFVQRLDRNGDPLSPITQVNSFTTGFQAAPALAVAPDGSFVVAWQSSGQAGTANQNDVYAQRFDAGGAKVGPEFLVNSSTAGSQSLPRIAMDGQGNFTIIWTVAANVSPADFDVQARRFAADGTPLGDEFTISTVTADNQQQPAIAMRADGASVMTWQSREFNDGVRNSNVYAQLFDKDGEKVGGEFRVNTTIPGNQGSAAAAMDAAGNFVIVWSSDGDIMGRRYDANGNPLGGEFRIETFTGGNQLGPAISMRPDGSFIVAWQSNGQGSSGGGIYARQFSATGAPVGDEFRLSGVTVPFPSNPSVAFAADGGLAAAWDDPLNQSLIFGRFFDADGSSRLLDLDGSAPGTGFAVTYAEGGPPVRIADDDAVLSEQIGAGLQIPAFGTSGLLDSLAGFDRATATLTGRQDGMKEFLFLEGTAAGITTSWDEATGTLTLQGPGNNAEFLAALKAIRYVNTDDTPGLGSRSVTVQFFGAPNATEKVVATIAMNAAPTGITLAGGIVTENMAGAAIGALTVADANPGDTHTFAVSDFRFEVVDGVLWLRPGIPLDHEAAPEVTVQVTATDSGGLSVTQALRIQVANLDEAFRGGEGNDTLRGADELFGRGGNDSLIGAHGDDLLDGGSGADTMVGGAGDDTYVVDTARDVVREAPGGGYDRVVASVSWELGAELERLSLSGTAGLSGTGNALANRIEGNAGANLLRGLDGNDRLTGGLGSDTLEGGAGDDTYFVGDAGDVVVEFAGAGYDRVVASVDWVLSAEVERLSLSGTAGLTGTGNALANRIDGNAGANLLRGMDGNDRLTGGLGSDTLEGGAGDDTYYVGDAGDVVVELAGGGYDRVVATVDWVLSAEVERLSLSGTADLSGTGNALGNRIDGNAGANRLHGLDGNDVLKGGAGDDTLTGGVGADRLDGGVGADSLVGGTGRDLFVFGSAVEADGDLIADFRVADGDRLDLRAIDANQLSAGDQAFVWIGSLGFSGVAGELRLAAGILEGDVDGDGAADFQIGLNGLASLPTSSLLL